MTPIVRCVALAVWLLLAAVAPGSAAQGAPVRVLVVTGGHDYPTDFYTVFEQPGIQWDHAVSNEEAFGRDIRDRYDVLVLYDMSERLSDEGRRHLRAFAEAGKGIVALHHAIVSYQDWDWYRDMVGGRYLLAPQGGRPASTYKHDEQIAVQIVARHAITAGLSLTRIYDETYKGMWIHPDVRVLMTTDHPLADRPLAWVSPYTLSRVAYIQLGHGREAHRDGQYRRLVANAIAWAGGSGS
jgi:type 1 glutamine amidotransferase